MRFAEASFPDPGMQPGGSGIPGVFIFFVVIVIGVGVVTTLVKVSQARRMAERSGMDPNEATAMTLLNPDGLAATYLASNLRPHDHDDAPAPGKSTAERLAELTALKESGAITEAEYAERRAAIIGSI